LGALLAVLFRTPTIINAVKMRLVWIAAACSALFLYVAYSSMTEQVGSLDHLFLFGLFYAALILLSLADRGSLPARLFRSRWLVYTGRISYGIYLFHQMINGIVHDIFFKRPPSLDNLPAILATLFALLLTFVVAQGTYHAFEKRFIAMGHRFAYSGR
jgi:peptidoglycan/LPS O-acetylase OafA/YrhL